LLRDIEIATDNGVEDACSLAIDRATEIEQAGDRCCWEAFESSGRAEYVDCVSADDNLLGVPIVYRSHAERDLLQEIAELRAEIKRLQNVRREGS
jgi:hypothetical protein